MLVVILIIVVGVWESIIAIHPTALVGAAIIGVIDQFPLRATLAAAAVVISTIVVLWIPAISIAAVCTDDNIVMNIKKEESPSYHCNCGCDAELCFSNASPRHQREVRSAFVPMTAAAAAYGSTNTVPF